jgi:uncharacterized protein (TIGR02611 family)
MTEHAAPGHRPSERLRDFEDAVASAEDTVEARVRPLIAGLRERRARHKQRNIVVRVVYLAAAMAVLIAGVLMLLLPGPAFVVIPVGLTLLALEFASAERMLDRALDQADAAKSKAQATTKTQRLLVVVAALLAAGAAAASAAIWDIPYLPV